MPDLAMISILVVELGEYYWQLMRFCNKCMKEEKSYEVDSTGSWGHQSGQHGTTFQVDTLLPSSISNSSLRLPLCAAATCSARKRASPLPSRVLSSFPVPRGRGPVRSDSTVTGLMSIFAGNDSGKGAIRLENSNQLKWGSKG